MYMAPYTLFKFGPSGITVFFIGSSQFCDVKVGRDLTSEHRTEIDFHYVKKEINKDSKD